MKAQTSAVTAVMMTGIIVSTVATSYMWGAPLLEKRQSQQQITQFEDQALTLEKTIREVSEAGEGSKQALKLDTDNGDVKINPRDDYMEIKFSGSSNYPIGTWNLIRGQSRQGLSFGGGTYGIEGENEKGIVAAKRSESSDSLLRIEFRNIRKTTSTGPELEKIDLVSSGSKEATGDVEVVITNEGDEVDSGSNSYQVSQGFGLRRTRSIVNIELR